MKELTNIFLTFILFLFFLSCKNVKNKENPISRVWNFEDVQHLFNKNNDTTYVINFWATTCPPCIKELPYFEKINQISDSKPIKVILINLDLEKHFESRVLPFVKKHKIRSQMIALHDENMSKWLDLVYSEWWGALPFTLIYKRDTKRYFLDPFEKFEDLEAEVVIK